MKDTRKQFQLQTGVFLKRPDVVTFDGRNKQNDHLIIIKYHQIRTLFLLMRRYLWCPNDHHGDSTARFVSDLVGNPEDRFSHNEARMKVVYIYPAKKFCTRGNLVNPCLNQEWMHLMFYIIVYRNHFAIIGRIPN